MKFTFMILFILPVMLCFAQSEKEALSKTGKDSTQSTKLNNEKKDIPVLKLNKLLMDSRIHLDPADIEYNADFKKASFKEIVGKGLSPDQVNAEENAKNILNDINKSMEDKRSGFQKAVQTALGIAQTALVVGLAVREVVKETKKD